MSPQERSNRARLAALSRTDRGARRTGAARSAFRQRLYDETPADLPDAERARLADDALRAHMVRMTVRAQAARRKAREADAAAQLAEELLASARAAAG